MQETAHGGVLIESFVHGIRGENDRQRQIAPGNTFREAQEVRFERLVFTLSLIHI